MNTGQGIFGPGGHGGGIFQTTVSGLGSWDTKQGIFGPGGHGGGIFQTTVSGLGAFDPFTGISSVCWNEFGFKGCSEKASQDANNFLYSMLNKGDIDYKPGSAEWTDKYNRLWNEGLKACVNQFCGASHTEVYGQKTTTTTVKAPTTTTTTQKAPTTSYSAPTAPTAQDLAPAAPSFALDTPGKKIAVVAAATLVALGAYYLWSKK